MGQTQHTPLFKVKADIRVSAAPHEVYAVVSDLPRSAEWSPECIGGTWVSGEPATVGAVFRGENLRSPDVVAWAPVVRGTWTTESQVVAAEPGRVFRWAMRDSSGRAQESVWSYEIEPADDGCVLVHHFQMDTPTEGIRGITAEMDEAEKRRFFADWSAKLAKDLQATLQNIKAVIEQK
ncbi:SRPBCC family protein [Streptomyces sp. NPDC020996]|uniref:SRPBCC family protein n=1 Tax=Streptomyces sp. NPDC020996 TaxID=3154791 RepID=UPI0033EC3E4C